MMERLNQQIQFILEIDKLKDVIRRSYLANGSRRENSGEHSWHLAMMALVLHEHADEPVDLLRVLKMVLIHDIIEIDAGDTYAFDLAAHHDKLEREQVAAARLFGLLPADLGTELRQLWDEFETRETPEAKFATSLDRLMPFLHNYYSGGISWAENGIVSQQVITRNADIRPGSETLWQRAQTLIEAAIKEGLLPPGKIEND